MFHSSKGNNTDSTLFVFSKDYVGPGFSCWGCIINRGLARNSECAFTENHILNFSLWLGGLFLGAGIQIFQNIQKIIGFHPHLSLLTDCQLSTQSQSQLRPWVTPPCRHLGMGKGSAPLSAGEAGDVPDRMPRFPWLYWGNMGMKLNSTQSISTCSEPAVHLLSSFHLYWKEKSSQVPQTQDFLQDIALLTSVSCFCKSQLLRMWPEFKTDAIVQKLGFPYGRNTTSKVCAVFQEAVGFFGRSPEKNSENNIRKDQRHRDLLVLKGEAQDMSIAFKCLKSCFK